MIDRIKAQESRAALAEVRKRLSGLNNDLRNALQAAANFQDPDGYLTEEGTRERQRQMRELAQQTFSRKMSDLQAEHAQHLVRVRDWAETKRPKLPANDGGQISLALASWDRARAMLDAGHSIPAVLERATDPLMALAIREWAGDWLMANQPPQGLSGMSATVDTSGLARSADDRVAQLMGGEVAEAIGMLRDAESAEAEWSPMAGFVSDALTTGRPQDGQQLMAAAIESHWASQQARQGYKEPESPAETSGAAA